MTSSIALRASLLATGFIAIVGLTIASARQTVPVLRYQPPANWYRSLDITPESYSANEVNAGLQIYRFRPTRPANRRPLHGTKPNTW